MPNTTKPTVPFLSRVAMRIRRYNAETTNGMTNKEIIDLCEGSSEYAMIVLELRLEDLYTAVKNEGVRILYGNRNN
jgi:hypothetical protein